MSSQSVATSWFRVPGKPGLLSVTEAAQERARFAQRSGGASRGPRCSPGGLESVSMPSGEVIDATIQVSCNAAPSAVRPSPVR
jgi:hypothetical protein